MKIRPVVCRGNTYIGTILAYRRSYRIAGILKLKRLPQGPGLCNSPGKTESGEPDQRPVGIGYSVVAAPAPTLLLLSADKALADFAASAVQPPWAFAHQAAAYTSPEMFARPNVQLVVLDDEAIEGSERGRLLTQIRRYLPTTPLLYIAATHNEATERQARTNGAHYYISKPLSLEHFGYVLQSFLRAQK